MGYWRRPRVRRRLQLVAAAALALLGLDLLRWMTIGTGEITRSDFPALLTGGVLLARGQRAGLYDPVRQEQVYRQLISGAHGGSLPFNHAPLTAALYAPLSGLPLSLAYHAAGAIQLLCLLGGCLLALRAAPWPADCPRLLRTTIVITSLAGAGTLPLLLQGQEVGVISLALGGSYLALRRGHPGVAGFLVGMAGAGTKPHLLLGLAVLVVVRRDLRLLGGLMTGALVAGTGSLVAVGPDGCIAFLRIAVGTTSALPWHWYLGLPAIPTSLIGESGLGRGAGLGLALCALSGTAWLGARWGSSRVTCEEALAAATCLSLAATVHLLGHDLVLLSPLVVAVAATVVPEPRRLTLMLGAWGLLVGATALDGVVGNQTQLGRATAGMLVALAVGCAVLRRRSQSADAEGRLQLRPAT